MDSIRVLHLNTYGGIGGAFIASDRLHQGLLRTGVDSVFVYAHILNNSDSDIIGSHYYRRIDVGRHTIERVLTKCCNRLGLNDIGNISSFSLIKKEYFQRVSVLNFHNLHSDYFSYLALPLLTKNIPAVWTLHDMWSLTGHCAYSYDCSRWQTGCGQCPYPGSKPPIRRDATYQEWRLKNWVYSQSNLTIVTPSSWLAEQTKQSMLNRFPIHHIPYGIDTEVYQPLVPDQCRFLLNIPIGKKVLMFGAQILTDPRKGSDLLLKALQSLPASLKAETVLLTIGDNEKDLAKSVGMSALNLGYVGSDHRKARAYSAADLFIFPSRADNLPLVLQESMACGTPMVSFNVGGISDLVRPGITGYLAAPEDTQDFCNGVVQLLEDNNLRQRMSHHCRMITLKEYSLELEVKRYLELYRQVLQN